MHTETESLIDNDIYVLILNLGRAPGAHISVQWPNPPGLWDLPYFKFKNRVSLSQ